MATYVLDVPHWEFYGIGTPQRQALYFRTEHDDGRVEDFEVPVEPYRKDGTEMLMIEVATKEHFSAAFKSIAERIDRIPRFELIG